MKNLLNLAQGYSFWNCIAKLFIESYKFIHLCIIATGCWQEQEQAPNDYKRSPFIFDGKSTYWQVSKVVKSDIRQIGIFPY